MLKCQCKEPCKKSESDCGCKTPMSGLYKIHCNDCGRYLLDAPASTATYCPDCKRWTKIEPETLKDKGVGNDDRECV